MRRVYAHTWARARGLTLIESLVATVVLSIAALGTMAYQYETAKQTRLAQAQITATRITRLLLEDWKASGASNYYNPEDLDMGVSHVRTYLADGLVNKEYRLRADNVPLHIVLSRPTGLDSPVPISVTAKWRLDYGPGDVRNSDPSVALSTYARGDEAAG